MKRCVFLVAVFSFGLTLTVAVVSLAEAAATSSFLTEYPVPGSPHHVTVEAPGVVWFTLPDQNAIGRLTVTSTVEYEVITYTIPTDDSEPYDLDYANGAIWFTERTGNHIGRLDPTTGGVDEFPVPTLDSRPTGIDAVPGSPAQVWFTEQSGNNLGQLVVTSTIDYTFSEYPLPHADAEPQDICFENASSVWFTAPGEKCIGNLNPSHWDPDDAFKLISDPGLQRPWAIQVDGSGYPWFTDVSGNQIGIFFPQTIGDFRLYSLPSADGKPYDLATAQGFVWFTEYDGNRVGRRSTSPSAAITEFGIPSAQPLGLAVDTRGHVWIAESATGKIAEWQPPYFHFVFLPLALKNQ